MNFRFLLAGWIFFLGVSVAQADEFTATLVKVADRKVTFVFGKGKNKKEMTLLADPKCRVVVAKHDAKAKKIEAGDEIRDGLKNPLFNQLDKETIGAWILTSTDNQRIVEMRLFQSVKKKKTG